MSSFVRSQLVRGLICFTIGLCFPIFTLSYLATYYTTKAVLSTLRK